MAKRSERAKVLAEAQAVKVVGYDHDWGDEEIDEAIEFLVRVVERAITSPRLMRLVELGRVFR